MRDSRAERSGGGTSPGHHSRGGIPGYLGFVAPREWYAGFTARVFNRPETAHAALMAARVILEKQLEEKPESGLTWSLLGQVKAALGEKEGAIEAGQRACEIWPLTTEPLWGLERSRPPCHHLRLGGRNGFGSAKPEAECERAFDHHLRRLEASPFLGSAARRSALRGDRRLARPAALRIPARGVTSTKDSVNS